MTRSCPGRLFSIQTGPLATCKRTQQLPTFATFARSSTFDRFQTLHNNSQQHITTCNRVCKRTQHVTSNNVASVCMGLYGPETQTNKSEINISGYSSLLSDLCHWNDENDLSQTNIENYSLWRHSCATLLLPMAWSRCDMLINAGTPERWNIHSIDLFNCCCCCVRVNRTPKIRIRKCKTENRKENGKQERKENI